jgi:four helix bundle protein
MELVEAVYRCTRGFPHEEVFGLTAQIRRAAISVPSNLAEGAGRNSSRELLHYVGISCGSVAELQTQLELAVRLNYLNADAECILLVGRVGKLITALRKSIRASLAV